MYKTISDLLSANNALAIIQEHTHRLGVMQEQLRRQLGPPLNQHLIVANFAADTLIIHTDSPAWAAKLRFRIPDILDIAKKSGEMATIGGVSIKVVIPGPAEAGRRRSLPPLSTENVQHLQKLADSVENQALADVMARLARHGRG
ncbi:MAG: DciA family protein [Gammaproteobacteria bacterium]